MIRKEKLAVSNLTTLLSASQCDGQLPVARIIITVLNRNARLPWWKKDIAGLDFANAEFGRHPLGPGITDPKYLFCECGEDQVIEDGRLCGLCCRKLK